MPQFGGRERKMTPYVLCPPEAWWAQNIGPPHGPCSCLPWSCAGHMSISLHCTVWFVALSVIRAPAAVSVIQTSHWEMGRRKDTLSIFGCILQILASHAWTMSEASSFNICTCTHARTHTHTHTHTHTQNHFTALWILSGTTEVSRHQNKHSPTHTYRSHQSPLICFIHLIRSTASSLFNPLAWQSFSTISLQVFFGQPLGLAPSTLYSNHCLLFATHAHTIAACFAVVPRLCHLVLMCATNWTQFTGRFTYE